EPAHARASDARSQDGAPQPPAPRTGQLALSEVEGLALLAPSAAEGSEVEGLTIALPLHSPHTADNGRPGGQCRRQLHIQNVRHGRPLLARLPLDDGVDTPAQRRP